MKKGKSPKGPLYYILIFALVFVVAYGIQMLAINFSGQVVNLEFSEFVQDLQTGQVESVKVNAGSRSYEGQLKNGEYYLAYAPSEYDMNAISENYIVPMAADGSLTVLSVKPSAFGAILSWVPSIIMFVMIIILYKNMLGGGNKGVMGFGKNKARMEKDSKVTFKDVAGCEEEKQELSEIVDFLKKPKKYTQLGARIPKGVLLVGPPGTGKTYISKAVAGEAGVPFFSISGSDFVEMFVGVGASRVRDLFEDAKKNSPCIIFIDEIDAVGRRRGAGIGGGNDEREQTLNQLLVEMDGFEVNEGIIVMAATNRPDVLDPAILRPGRFDRQITIGTPDIKGREEVFKVHAKNKPLGSDVNLGVLARRTPGFTPADIENMMNEAALLTARRNGTEIHMADLEEAITRVIAGPKKTSHVMSDKEKKLTAYHEAGHAIVMRSIPDCDPVHQVTIMPRGMAGGFTLSLPEEDKYYSTKSDMLNELCHLLGGRVSESIVLGDISTGASNDLERATKIAHDMVVKYGMTDAVGPINYSDADEVFLGRDFTSKQNYSEELASKIDKEVRRILDEAYDRTKQILTEHREELDRVANGLLVLETLDKDQFEALYTNASTAEELKNVRDEAEAEQKAADEAEAAKRAAEEKTEEAETRKALNEGKRVAVIDKSGKLTFRTLNEIEELKKKAEEPAAPEITEESKDDQEK
ncbi:MAG: ATP-dependent zinc metalloprotease FtsH [Bacillota bacterium]|nr:ATP-dependent zinc metalloprotease FtsH [Bacillota bacterium]